jgi:hypothetical protein
LIGDSDDGGGSAELFAVGEQEFQFALDFVGSDAK